MTAKQQALVDIQEDLNKNHKSFIAFRNELNTVMRKIVSEQIKNQRHLTSPFNNSPANSQLVAHCSFISKGNVDFNDYTKYYK